MTAKTETEVPLRLISTARVADLIDASKSHVDYLRRTDPTFPQGVKLGTAFNSAVRFAEHEVLAWIAARMAARRSEAAAHRARGAQLAANLQPSARRGGRKCKATAEAA
jgi:predicted DNA-binding transcriptional regulator AlpA